MSDLTKAANFIAFFEGYQPTAKWDVNAWRLGFGSDTEGPSQVRVTKGMSTTRDRALANLALRLPQFEAEIVKQIGSSAWAKLEGNTQLALLSFTYNYGDLTATLCHAASVGAGISSAISARQSDNGGENAKRRFAEAAMAASDGV